MAKKLNADILPNGNKVDGMKESAYGRVSAAEWNQLVEATGEILEAHNELVEAVEEGEEKEEWLTEAEMEQKEAEGTLKEGVTYFVYETEEDTES